MLPSMSDPREARVRRFGFTPELEDRILKAKRCFIAGTGPSLAKVNPVTLQDEVVIGVNHILRTDIRPDILCIADPGRFDEENIPAFGGKIIVPKHVFTRHKAVLGKKSCYSGLEYVDATSLQRNIQHIDQFDPSLSKVYWAASVVADLAIPLATYLGFEKIYTLGLDGVRSSFPSSHAWGNDPAIYGPPDTMAYYLYQLAGQLAAKAGAQVGNASFGGVVQAFPKVSLDELAPGLVRRELDSDPEGKLALFRGSLLKIARGVHDTKSWRAFDPLKSRWLRTHGKRIILDGAAGIEDTAEAHFYLEPSFVRPDWVSFRSCAMTNHYITANNSFSSYDLRTAAGIFSPYFSSFPLFQTPDQAKPRIEFDRMLATIDQQSKAVGNLMVAHDRGI